MAFLLPILGGIATAATAVRAVGSLFGGGPAPALAAAPPLIPPPPPPPPPPPFEPTRGVITPVADFVGGGDSAIGPLVGTDAIGTSQPVPDGLSTGAPLEVSPGQRVFDLPTDVTPGMGITVPGTGTGMPVPGGTTGVLGEIGQITGQVGGILRSLGIGVGAAGLGVGGGVALAARGVLPAIERVVPLGILRALGPAGAALSIYQLYAALRRRGHSHQSARRIALAAHGIRHRRRRMRPTNVRALRRAIRRVRGARRILGKIRGLHVAGGRFGRPHFRRRRLLRRGDLPAFLVEDALDLEDESEDLGLAANGFRNGDSSDFGDDLE